MENNTHDSMEESILARIRAEAVHVRPRAYFSLQLVALALLAIAVLVFSILVFNFIFFTVRINGNGTLLDFGPRGFLAYALFFPWPFLFLDIACIVLLEMLVRRFRFGYRSPILYLLIGLAAICIAGGFAMDRGTSFNDHLLNRAHENRLPPPFGALYGRAPQPPGPGSGVCKCTITAIHGTTISADDADADPIRHLTIIADPHDPALSTLKVGDVVFVAGDESSSTIRAYGIHRDAPQDAAERQ